MAVRTNVDGVETLLTPILSEDGSRIPQGDGFAYSAPDGTVITLVFENGPQQQNFDDDYDFASKRLSDVPLVAPSQASEHPPEPELWSGQKTRSLINKYKELKDLVGKKGGFWMQNLPDQKVRLLHILAQKNLRNTKTQLQLKKRQANPMKKGKGWIARQFNVSFKNLEKAGKRGRSGRRQR
ncbi:hypothetical protein MRX96_001025 [Rhipicephalus microplus]